MIFCHVIITMKGAIFISRIEITFMYHKWRGHIPIFMRIQIETISWPLLFSV